LVIIYSVLNFQESILSRQRLRFENIGRLLLVGMLWVGCDATGFGQDLALTGRWRFQTGKVLGAEDVSFNDASWGAVDPDQNSGQGMVGESGGFAVFRRQVEVGKGPHALALIPGNKAVEVFWDGYSMGASGHFGKLARYGNRERWQFFPLPGGPGVHTLVVRVQVGTHRIRLSPHIGFSLGRPLLGPLDQVQLNVEARNGWIDRSAYRQSVTCIVLATMFFLMAIWLLHLALVMEKAKDVRWFGWMSFFMGLRQVGLAGWMDALPLATFHQGQLLWLFFYLACMAFIAFLADFHKDVFPLAVRIYLWSFLVPILLLATLPSPWAWWFTLRIGLFWPLPMLAVFLYMVFRSLQRGDSEARLLAGSSIALVAGAVHETGYFLDLWPSNDALSWGLAFFSATMMMVINSRYVHSHRRSQALSQSLELQIQEKERFSREIHDGIGTTFSNAILLLSSVIDRIDYSEARGKLEMLLVTLRSGLAELRGLMWALHEDESSVECLAIQLRERAWQCLAPNDVQLEFREPLAGVDLKVSASVRFHVLRMIQELLANTLKHAKASQVTILISLGKNELTIHYSDNGQGCDLGEPRKKGYGLANLDQRCRELGGSLSLETIPGQGFRAITRVPLQQFTPGK